MVIITNAEYNNAVGYATKNLCALILHPRSNSLALAVVHQTIVNTAKTIPHNPNLCTLNIILIPANKFTGNNAYPNIDMTVHILTAPFGFNKFNKNVMAKQPLTPKP
jgi:hypothetical protein